MSECDGIARACFARTESAGGDLSALPVFISAIQNAFGGASVRFTGMLPSASVMCDMLSCTLQTNQWSIVNDTRALQDPRNPAGPRGIGCYFNSVPNGNTFAMDVIMAPEYEGSLTYQLAVYFVDYDHGSREQTVELLDRWTLGLISPVQYLTEFDGALRNKHCSCWRCVGGYDNIMPPSGVP